MRILSLNVALFETNNKKLFSFLKKAKADITCLQEVSKKEDKKVNLKYISLDYIDKATKDLKYAFFGPTLMAKDFHKKNFHKKESFDFEFGGFIQSGNYTKSRYRIVKKDSVFIDSSEIKITDWSNWPDKQSKAVLITDLKLAKGKRLRVLNYHGVWTREKIGNKETLKACKKVYALSKEVDYPVIICGDFNLFPDTKSMKVFKKDFISLVDEYEITTTRPKSNELSRLEKNVVDYFLISKDIKVKSFQVLDIDVSDHLPLILDFEI